MIHFIKAIWSWLTGTPLLPKIFIGQRWACCIPCKSYRKGWIRSYCNECKCTLSPKRHIFNKLAHADEECPRLYWPKVKVKRGK